uniref:Zinc fingers and homeoboxes 2 n=1 Tax=Sinocyclocheilus grahami TaxID=75366 RepID=A0A672LSZ2_SINGR
MSSRRKSFNPCMLRATSFPAEDSLEMDVSAVPLTTHENWMSLNNEEEDQSEWGSASEQGLNIRDHEEIPQSESPVSTLYLCTICNFSTNKFESLSCHNKVQHPGESHFKVRHIKLDSQSILEQTIESKNDRSIQEAKDTIKDLGPFLDSSNSAGEDTGKTPMENSSILDKGLDVEKELDSPVLKDEIRAVSVNGTIIIPEPVCHVTPLLQRPPSLSTSPTIAVPIHTTKYNPILDSNVTLITSFNRFPYPTHTELSWLTAASRHPEDQIKVWFTTQRLKQGITWSLEEVEEARKKMFNGSIPPTHQTCEVLPAPAGKTHNPGQAQSATCHGFGQTSLASNITADRSPTTCTPGIATAVRQAQTLKRPLGTSFLASVVKRPTGDPKESMRMPPPPAPPPERLAINGKETTNSQNDSQKSHVEFALREHCVPTQFPLLERVKDKSPEQMKLLEESFQRNSFPSYNEVEHLVITTRMSREEIESWFLERRSLRDDLEQTLLNSMGSKRESQQTLLNGAQRRSGTLTFSPVPQVSKTMNLLKNVFVQNRWPSPVEFRHLEMQARLARTELVHWFRDSRLAQQSRILNQKEMFGEQNSCRDADATKRPLREENTKPSSPEFENWFSNMLACIKCTYMWICEKLLDSVIHRSALGTTDVTSALVLRSHRHTDIRLEHCGNVVLALCECCVYVLDAKRTENVCSLESLRICICKHTFTEDCLHICKFLWHILLHFIMGTSFGCCLVDIS